LVRSLNEITINDMSVKNQFIKLTSSICTINGLISNMKRISFATRFRLDEVRNGT
jgi:hypothetical protein